MTATELLHAIGPELREEIVAFLQTEQRPAYRAIIENLASARRLRLVFVQRKPKKEQATWLLEQLRMKTNEEVTGQIFQIWLLKGQSDMLITFLDAAGIEHNGEGEVEELPEEIAEDKAEAAVEALLKDHSAKKVALYLYMFQSQRPGGWEGLTKAVDKRPELKLGEEA